VLLAALPRGPLWVIGFILVVVAVDTGAYATGLNLGKHPMAPRISPKKTWEGFAGSVGSSIVMGILVAWLMLGLPWWAGIVLGVLISGSATLGDLTESMIKRDLGIKDISSFLPGHGGLLDRIDSILPSAAIAYLLYLVVNH
jgi:phosphatidate cytidylyltransferase